MISKKQDYNNIPVEYCNECLHLGLKKLETTNFCFCKSCGTTVNNEKIPSCHISEWEDKFKDLYGYEYITRNK
jgi:hypothetical protein